MRLKGFALLPVVIIIALIGIVGYLVYQNTQLKNGGVNTTPAITNTVTNIPKASSSPDPTANWKTYTNTQYYYEFKYPNKVTIDTTQTDVTKAMFMGQKQIDSGRTQAELSDGYFFIVAVTSKSGLSLNDAYKQRVESFNNVCDPSKMGKAVAVKIDGNNALMYKASCLGDSITYLISHRGMIFEITQTSMGDNVDLPNYQKINDQILSTFKFTQ